MRLLGTIAGVQIVEATDARVVFISGAAIDSDGSGGNLDKDPFFQPDTTLHHNAKALNAYKERFVVVPPLIVQKTRGIVFGCQAFVTNLITGKVVTAVVGDLGPAAKIGEISVACAQALGLNSNPNHGGTDAKAIGYEILPGVAASVDGIVYDLQPWRA